MNSATAHAARETHVRLSARGRVVVLVVLVTVVFALLSLWNARSVAVPRVTSPVNQSVVVQPGDTLWQIAAHTLPAADPRATIERILQLNQLSGAGDLHAGQLLVVPTQ